MEAGVSQDTLAADAFKGVVKLRAVTDAVSDGASLVVVADGLVAEDKGGSVLEEDSVAVFATEDDA